MIGAYKSLKKKLYVCLCLINFETNSDVMTSYLRMTTF